MASHFNKENHSPTAPNLLPRERKLSAKQAAANKNAQEVANQKKLKKQLQAARIKKRALAKKASAIVEHTGDSKQIRELKGKVSTLQYYLQYLTQPQARVHQAELECDAAERQAKLTLAHRSPTPTATQPDSIPRPRNFSKVTVGLLRQHLGLDGAEHKNEWLRI